MSNYTKATDFAAKDALITGNPAKVIKGIDINTEFVAIETAIATKYDSATLGASGGGALIGYLPQGTGAVATTVQAKLRESVSVLDFGASAAASASANVVSFQAALDYANSISGAEIDVPAESFTLNAALTIYPNTTLKGRGWGATVLTFTHTGAGIKGSNPVNGSYVMNTRVSGMSIKNSNGANLDGGVVDVCGTYVHVDNCLIQGWKYGIIFDQTEVAVIHQNNIVSNTTAQIWLVNGDDYTIGASAGFTNRIVISNNQLNAFSTAYLILDDGGGAHLITGNNMNGGLDQIRASGVGALVIQNNELEVAGNYPIHLVSTTSGGDYVGGCTGFSITGNTVGTTFTAGHDYNIYIQSGHGGTIADNVFYYAQTAALGSIELDISNITVAGNVIANKGPAKTATPFLVNSTALTNWQNRCNWRQGATTYHAGLANAGARTLTPASMGGIVPGSRVTLVNADGTNVENCLVTATTASTFDCTLASNKAANFLVFGTPLEGSDEAGTAVLTLTGCTTSPTVSVPYVKKGGVVVLALGYVAATSNTTAMTLTGIPTRLTPSVARIDTANIADNGVWAIGAMQIDTDGVLYFSKTLSPNFSTSFTAAGGKGIMGKQFTYVL